MIAAPPPPDTQHTAHTVIACACTQSRRLDIAVRKHDRGVLRSTLSAWQRVSARSQLNAAEQRLQDQISAGQVRLTVCAAYRTV